MPLCDMSNVEIAMQLDKASDRDAITRNRVGLWFSLFRVSVECLG